jgi:release factor glutamine methyltransferase
MLFKSVIRQRAKREPFQYITGRQEFYGLEFEVRPGVLIPRPETEFLVEAAIEVLSPIDNPRFYEIGVGSGCISVSILHAVQGARAVAVDTSDAALELADRNADKHGVAERLELISGDTFERAIGQFDLIVSNPPYIPHGDIQALQPEVRQFEPREALAGGPDGLSVIERIVDDAPLRLLPAGVLLVEIGFDQAESVEKLFDQNVWQRVEFIADLQDIPRIAMAVLCNQNSTAHLNP